jgi:hypothetical protein
MEISNYKRSFDPMGRLNACKDVLPYQLKDAWELTVEDSARALAMAVLTDVTEEQGKQR